MLKAFKDKFCLSFPIERFTYYFLVALFFICIFLIYQVFLQSVEYFNRTPWDGTFQTLFPLREMDNGRYPGVDFYYFHGNGIPYLLYPIYWVMHSFLGYGVVISALISTFIVNTIFLLIPFYIFLNFFYKRLFVMVLMFVPLFVFDIFSFTGYYLSPLFLGAPMGIRFAPHFLAIIVAAYVYPKLSVNTKSNNSHKSDKIFFDRKMLTSDITFILLLAFVTSLGILLGAEQGFYSAFGVAVSFFILFVIKNKVLNGVAFFIAYVVLFMVFIFILSFVFYGNFNTLEAIKTISDNQVWVFGVYPNSFFSNISEVFSLDIVDALASQLITVFSVFLYAIILLLWISKIVQFSSKYMFTLNILFLGALISWVSNLGYIGAHQTALFMRFDILLIIPVVLAIFKLNLWIEKK